MKSGDFHPKRKKVIFKDIASGKMFLAISTVNTKEKAIYEDGNEYPLYILDISSDSHPFFTGKQQLVDTAGRIDRFNKRYKSKQ